MNKQIEIPPSSSDEMNSTQSRQDPDTFSDPFAISCKPGTMYPETCELCKMKLHTELSKKTGKCVHCRGDIFMEKNIDRSTARLEDHYKTNAPWAGNL